jgi:4-oxalocrotonate tautomerase
MFSCQYNSYEHGVDNMPLTRISMRKGKSAEYKQAIFKSIYEAMLETFNVPENDLFMLVHEHEADQFIYGENYLGINKTDDLLMIQITVSNTRNVEQKKALYARMAALLVASTSIRPEDIFINLVEVSKENWSFGHGIAQYA